MAPSVCQVEQLKSVIASNRLSLGPQIPAPANSGELGRIGRWVLQQNPWPIKVKAMVQMKIPLGGPFQPDLFYDSM